MIEYVVREAGESDIPRMCSLEKECFSHPWTEGDFRTSMAGGSCAFFVCESNGGDILGYIGSYFVLDECSITNVCVTEHARRMGIGNALLGALEAECRARKTEFVTLEVRVSNAAAISVYESRGYQRCGTRAGFYQNPREDAFVYRKNI